PATMPAASATSSATRHKLPNWPARSGIASQSSSIMSPYWVCRSLLICVLGAALHQQHDRAGLDRLLVLVQHLEAEFQHAALRGLAWPCLQRRDFGADGIAELYRRLEFPGYAEQAERRAVDPVHLRHQSDGGR